MNVAVFDRLAYLDALKAGGVSEEHARAHASALDAALRDSVATKGDLEREIGKLDGRFAQIEARFAQTDAKIAETKSEILRWMLTAMLGQTALLLTVLKLL
ncbi:MAG: hypothetical protein EA355_14455 [Rhodobacteraceae bacterium]|nr:MAG: hypothetical protein EA355_14455 [Paracoccaceae bacterium]